MSLRPIIDSSTISTHIPVQPSLRFIFRLASNLADPVIIGSSGEGTRKVVSLTTGRLFTEIGSQKGLDAFEGAIYLEGGADYLTVDALGDSRLDARYVFKLSSGRKFAVNTIS